MNTQTHPVLTPERLDTFLTNHLDATRSAIAALIKKGHVAVDGQPAAKPGLKLKAGQTVTVTLPEAEEEEGTEVDFDIPVLYEDDHLLVLNKPAGVVIHEAASHKGATLVDWLKAKGYRLSTISGEERHGIVHRLDKETTGAIVVAKTNEAHVALARQLENRTMGRYYLALIDLSLKEDTVVEAPVGRNPANRVKMGVVSGGREAKSAFCKLAVNDALKAELIAAKLFTGRTHQIRVHLAHLNRHIFGDELYGYKPGGVKLHGFFLHAYNLYLVHPATGETLFVTAPVPDHFQHALNKLFTKETLDDALDTDRLRHRFGFAL